MKYTTIVISVLWGGGATADPGHLVDVVVRAKSAKGAIGGQSEKPLEGRA